VKIGRIKSCHLKNGVEVLRISTPFIFRKKLFEEESPSQDHLIPAGSHDSGIDDSFVNFASTAPKLPRILYNRWNAAVVLYHHSFIELLKAEEYL
jgi:hypothetical protein